MTTNNGVRPLFMDEAWTRSDVKSSAQFENFTYLGKLDRYPRDLRVPHFDPYFKDFCLDYRALHHRYWKMRNIARTAPSNELLHEALSKYDIKRGPLPENKHLRFAIARAFKAFNLVDKPHIDNLDSISSLDIKMTSGAGWPFMCKKAKVWEEMRERWPKIKETLVTGSWHRLAPCTLGARTYPKDKQKPKVRLVWAYPFDMTVAEAHFARPLIDAYMQTSPRPMFLGSAFIRSAGQTVTSMISSGERVWNTDYSRFDATAHPKLIRIAFSILKKQFRLWNPEAEQMWNGIQEYFIHTPICLQDGSVFRKHGGVPSGSYFTQLIDSIINYIGIVYAFSKDSNTLVDPFVLGDDGLFTVPNSCPSTRESISLAVSDLQLILNPDKTIATRKISEIKFLGHEYKDGYAFRPFDELFTFMLYPEQRVETPGESFIRASQLSLDSTDKNQAWCILVSGYRKWLEKKFGKLNFEVMGQKTGKWFQFIANESLGSMKRDFFTDQFRRMHVYWW